jgi:putative transcription factor
MRCEVCGRKIIGPPNRAVIEGARMLACGECAKLGSVYFEAKNEPLMKKVTRRLPKPVLPTRRQPALSETETTELVENFSGKIRQAREKMGLTLEEFGKKINEKASVLRKIETGKMTPDNILSEKLEHALHMKLLVPVSEPKVPTKALAGPRTPPTLGDLIKVRKEKEVKK